MRLKFGITSFHVSLAGMALAIWGLVTDHMVVATVGLVIVFTERIIVGLMIIYAQHIQRKMAAQMYEGVQQMAEMLLQQHQPPQPKKPFPPQQEG